MILDKNLSNKTMSYYNNIIDETLESLASHRIKMGIWSDKEEGSGIIKTCEALETFFSPYLIDSSNMKSDTIDIKIIIDDIIKMNKDINNQGFIPYPYLNVKEDFTDCVAFVLRLFVHFNKYLEENHIKIDDDLKSAIHVNINKCVDWLIKSSICTKSTCCWDAIEVKKDKDSKSLGNVYFTYSAMLALSHSITYFELDNKKQKQIEETLTKGGTWLGERYNDVIGRFFGGIIPIDSNIIYTPYAIIAIITSWNYQTDKIKLIVKNSISEFLNVYLKDPIELAQRAYYRFPYEKDKNPLLYEDRSTIATTLTALSLAANPELGLNIIDSSYYRILNSIAEELVSYRNEISKLWNKSDNFVIYYNQRATEALANFVKYGKTTEIILSEYEMRAAIRNGLMREEVIRAVMDSIQKEVNKKTILGFKE